MRNRCVAIRIRCVIRCICVVFHVAYSPSIRTQYSGILRNVCLLKSGPQLPSIAAAIQYLYMITSVFKSVTVSLAVVGLHPCRFQDFAPY